MNIYRLVRDENDVRYDEAAGFVVTAISADQARELAAECCGDEGQRVWRDFVEVERIGTNPDDIAKVELRDFKAG